MGWDEDEDQRRELIRDLQRLLDSVGPIDGVIVGGDVGFSAAITEYKVAHEWLKEMCDVSNLDFSRVWMVPGNHDVDRKVLSRSDVAREFRGAIRNAAAGGVDEQLRRRLSVDPAAEGLMLPFRNYNRFASEFGCAVTAEQPHWFDTTLVCASQPIRLTGLNSAIISDEDDDNETDERKLVLGTWQCTLPREDGVVHVAVCHHPPSWLRDWETVEPYLCRAHVLLFGHEHTFGADQSAPGQTVHVYAGAVGPERLGGSAEDELLPSWDLLELTCDGSAVHVTVRARVWHRMATCFGEHPDGVMSFDVQLDLSSVEGAAVTSDAEPPVPAMAASPLADDNPPVLERGIEQQGPSRRRLGVRFMHLPVTRRLEIAKELDVLDEPEDLELPLPKMLELILTRIRDRSLIDRLEEELDRG